MATASETLDIPRASAEIFDFLADGSQNHLWQPDVVSVIFAAGPTERAVWAQTVRTGGRERKSDYRVTLYERPGRIEFTVFSGSPRPVYTWELRSLDETSTRVTLTVDVTPRWSPFPTYRIGARRARVELGRLEDLAAALTPGTN